MSRNQALVTRPLYIDIVFDAKILYDRDTLMGNILKRFREANKPGAEGKRNL